MSRIRWGLIHGGIIIAEAGIHATVQAGCLCREFPSQLPRFHDTRDTAMVFEIEFISSVYCNEGCTSGIVQWSEWELN
ncbi:hypothetical protein OAG34_01505 [bacterium]|nr:hypothetical protein [bacterium]